MCIKKVALQNIISISLIFISSHAIYIYISSTIQYYGYCIMMTNEFINFKSNKDYMHMSSHSYSVIFDSFQFFCLHLPNIKFLVIILLICIYKQSEISRKVVK